MLGYSGVGVDTSVNRDVENVVDVACHDDSRELLGEDETVPAVYQIYQTSQ